MFKQNADARAIENVLLGHMPRAAWCEEGPMGEKRYITNSGALMTPVNRIPVYVYQQPVSGIWILRVHTPTNRSKKRLRALVQYLIGRNFRMWIESLNCRLHVYHGNEEVLTSFRASVCTVVTDYARTISPPN